ncbi:MAG: RNA polymerase sigma factor [Lentilitoribacter sp.]|jgi:RNA polymerase sigma-70 factor (ECF subfamily)
MFFNKSARKEVEDGIKPIFPRLWRYCLVLTGNKDWADDLAQAVCLKALEKADQYKPGTKLDRWLFTIAHNSWINELRKNAVRTSGGIANVDEIDIPDTKPDPESNILASEVLKEVMALPEAQRVAVILVYIEGYSYQEAADALEIPIGTIMSRLSAARTKLANKLNDESQIA